MNALERRLTPIARTWAGNIPIWYAKKQGIDASAIRHWAKDNPNVSHPMHGIYYWSNDDECINDAASYPLLILAKLGEGSYLWGPSVFQYLELGTPAAPYTFAAARGRRTPIDGVRIQKATETPVLYKGVPCQPLIDAAATVMPTMSDYEREDLLRDIIDEYPQYTSAAEDLGAQYGILS